MKVCRVGLIGCGQWGRIHLSAYQFVPNAKIVAVADVNEQQAIKAAREAKAENWYKDYSGLIRRDDVDMVDVCLPPYLHSKVVIEAAQAGKHVLCEKPISTNLDDADRMIKTTKRAGVKFMVGFMCRFDPLYIRIKECVDNGTVGTPILMWLTNVWRPFFMDAPPVWNKEKEKSGGMQVEHLSHWFDQFRWWSGEGESVFAVIKTFDKGISIDDNASLAIKFRNGAFLSIAQSWHSYLNWNNLGVVGENGSAQLSFYPFDVHKGVLRVRTRGRPVKVTRAGRSIKAFVFKTRSTLRIQREIAHFVHCVLEDKEPLVSGEDGRAALEFAVAAYKSSDEGRPISLPLS